MFASQSVWKRKRQDLSTRRLVLIQRLKVSPNDSGVASQLQVIDAEIAECTRNIERGLPPRGPMAECKT